MFPFLNSKTASDTFKVYEWVDTEFIRQVHCVSSS